MPDMPDTENHQRASAAVSIAALAAHQLQPPTDAAWMGLLADADPWLSKRETAAFRGVSIATLDRPIKPGRFPRGEAISPGRRGWRLSVVKGAPAVEAHPIGGKLVRKGDKGRA